MKIVLTGGGTAGHAMVNVVLAKLLNENKNDSVIYIGSHLGAERQLMERIERVTYFPISTSKLRRYFSLENGKDFFRVCRGIAQAYRVLKREEANVVFSSGGFVSLSVVLAARLLKLPVLIRETDITMGLANRICAHFAKKIITTFPDTLCRLQNLPCECGGLVIRPELLTGGAPNHEVQCPPRVLVMGGSLGSQMLNRAIWENIEQLSQQFQIHHLCGRGQTRPDVIAPGYVQQGYGEDMAGLYAQADVVVTRCGSNAISEGLALGKRMVCIPISSRFSRGEQMGNANYAKEHGSAVVVNEAELCGPKLATAILEVLKKPIKQECVLSEQELNENCLCLVKEIHMAASQNWENSIAKKIRANKVVWNRLSPLEFWLYAEIAEKYDNLTN